MRTGGGYEFPGPKSVARPAGLLMQVCGATFADVMTACCAIEPVAVYPLPPNGRRGIATTCNQHWSRTSWSLESQDSFLTASRHCAFVSSNCQETRR